MGKGMIVLAGGGTHRKNDGNGHAKLHPTVRLLQALNSSGGSWNKEEDGGITYFSRSGQRVVFMRHGGSTVYTLSGSSIGSYKRQTENGERIDFVALARDIVNNGQVK